VIQKSVEGAIFTLGLNVRLELYFSASVRFPLSFSLFLSVSSHLPYAFPGAEIRENGRKLKETDNVTMT